MAVRPDDRSQGRVRLKGRGGVEYIVSRQLFSKLGWRTVFIKDRGRGKKRDKDNRDGR